MSSILRINQDLSSKQTDIRVPRNYTWFLQLFVSCDLSISVQISLYNNQFLWNKKELDGLWAKYQSLEALENFKESDDEEGCYHKTSKSTKNASKFTTLHFNHVETPRMKTPSQTLSMEL